MTELMQQKIRQLFIILYDAYSINIDLICNIAEIILFWYMDLLSKTVAYFQNQTYDIIINNVLLWSFVYN